MQHVTRHKNTAQGLTTVALVTSLLWLAACSPTPATSTEVPAAAATVAATTEAAPASATSTTEEATPEAATEAAAGAVVKLNLNRATNDEFLTIPNMGDRMVREFNEYRPYTSILQFRREIGKYVDEEQVTAYEEYVYVPVVPNEADAETLQQIPGVTPEIAEQLIAGRPYASSAAFVEALGALITPDELAIGESYLESE